MSAELGAQNWPTGEAIRTKFRESRSTYSESSSFHDRLVEELLALAPDSFQSDRILEIGSHTGSTTSSLTDKWPKAKVFTLDLQKEGPKLGLHTQADGEYLPFPDQSFSAVVSGSTFQWFEDLPSSLSGVMNCLEPGGKLGFTQFLYPSLQPFASSVEKVSGDKRFLPLLEADTLKEIVSKKGRLIHFSVIEETRYFKDLKAIHLFLKKMGVGAPSFGHKSLKKAQLRELKSILCRNIEKDAIPLQFCGALVWLEKQAP